MREIIKNKNGQAVAFPTIQITANDFKTIPHTEIRWLGGGGAMINSRGTNIMIDPVLEGFDMPLLIDMPILPQEVPSLDGILITHIDNDHFSRLTCQHLKDVCQSYHAPNYVADVMNEQGFLTQKHDINDSFSILDMKIRLTHAKHNWQNDSTK